MLKIIDNWFTFVSIDTISLQMWLNYRLVSQKTLNSLDFRVLSIDWHLSASTQKIRQKYSIIMSFQWNLISIFRLTLDLKYWLNFQDLSSILFRPLSLVQIEPNFLTKRLCIQTTIHCSLIRKISPIESIQMILLIEINLRFKQLE